MVLVLEPRLGKRDYCYYSAVYTLKVEYPYILIKFNKLLQC